MQCRHEPSPELFRAVESKWKAASASTRPTTYLDVGVAVNLDFSVAVLHTTPEKYCQEMIDGVNAIYQQDTPQFVKWSGLTPSEMESEAGITSDVAQAIQRFLSGEVADKPRIRIVLREVNYRPDMGDVYLDASDPAQVKELKRYRFPRNDRSLLPIWVTRLVNGELGFARFPFSGSWQDFGVVIDVGTTASYLSSPSLLSYSLNRTLAHELGHSMGLFHVFTPPNIVTQSGLGRLEDPLGDGSVDTQNVLGDGAADTPIQSAPTQGNPLQLRSTSVHNSLGQVVMFVNFMDYTDDAAMLTLTRDQCGRIDYFLRNDVSTYVDFINDTGKGNYGDLDSATSRYGSVRVNRLVGNAGYGKRGTPLSAPSIAGVVTAVLMVLVAIGISVLVVLYHQKHPIGKRSHHLSQSTKTK